jgi:N-acetylmuramoyl-L-alanine amidase
MNTEQINKIVIHCSATRETSNYTIEQLRRDHQSRGFRDVGYNLYIRKNGRVYIGRPLGDQLAHARGYNSDSFAICYEGGLDKYSRPKDTRTPAQKQAMQVWILALKRIVPKAIVMGHRDLSPDLNNDGKITANEYMKQCPCFDVKKEYNY